MFAIMEPCYLPTQEQMTDPQFCIMDLKHRKHIRANYPGACSLEYQNVMDVVKTVLIGWNNKKKEGSHGLFGIPSAYADGCEDQGRKLCILISQFLLKTSILSEMQCLVPTLMFGQLQGMR